MINIKLKSSITHLNFVSDKGGNQKDIISKTRADQETMVSDDDLFQ